MPWELVDAAVGVAVTGYIFVVRGMPVLVLMFMTYFSLPTIGVNVNVFVVVGGALVVYVAAFVAEITRRAVLSVPRGQIGAAKSLGMPWRSILRLVRTHPSSALWEISFAAREIAERTLAVFQIRFAVMALYFAICSPLSVPARRLERRSAYGH